MAEALRPTVVARLPMIDGAVETSRWLAKRGANAGTGAA
jgi:hypothetical protein